MKQFDCINSALLDRILLVLCLYHPSGALTSDIAAPATGVTGVTSPAAAPAGAMVVVTGYTFSTEARSTTPTSTAKVATGTPPPVPTVSGNPLVDQVQTSTPDVGADIAIEGSGLDATPFDLNTCALPGYAFLPALYPSLIKPLLQLNETQRGTVQVKCEERDQCVGFSTRGALYAITAQDWYWWRPMPECNSTGQINSCCGTYMVSGQEGSQFSLQIQTLSGTKALLEQCQDPWSNKTLSCEALTARVRSWPMEDCLNSCFACCVGGSNRQLPAPTCKSHRSCRFRCRSLCTGEQKQNKGAAGASFAVYEEEEVRVQVMSSDVVGAALSRNYAVVKDQKPKDIAASASAVVAAPGKVCSRADRSCCSLC
jgi:hypothetical protein